MIPPSPPSPRRGGAGGLTVLLLLALAGVASWLWLRADGAEAAARVDPDRVVVVQERDVVDGVIASGRVEPLARVAVMSRASGIIEALHADEGDRVEAHQVLVELDREQLEADLEQDRADLLAAEARLRAARARLAEARVRVDDPEVEFLRREAQRFEELYGAGQASLNDRDTTARALAAAEFRVRLVEASLPVLEASVAEAEAQLAAAQASLERAETTLREATIRSPIDGVVLTRDKEVGDGVSSILTAGGNATQIMVLGELSSMHVEARVDEVDLGRIEVGMPAIVTVDAHRGHAFDGRVERIAPAGTVDENGIVTFGCEVSVADPEGLLKPDMTADAKLVVARRGGVPSVPQIAVRREPDGRWFADRVVGEGEAARVEPVEVELGLSDGLVTEVRAGLSVGDRVLVPLSRRG